MSETRTKTGFIAALSAALLIQASPAEANIGISLIFITLPGMLIAFIPVVLIESVVLCRMLGLKRWVGLKQTAVANLVSTLVGVPLAWVAQMPGAFAFWAGTIAVSPQGEMLSDFHRVLAATLGAAHLGPIDDPAMRWMTLVALLFSLIPAFFASWLIEYRIIARRAGLEKWACRTAIFQANLASYCFLATTVLVLWMNLPARP
jgi:hypothetical protein